MVSAPSPVEATSFPPPVSTTSSCTVKPETNPAFTPEPAVSALAVTEVIVLKAFVPVATAAFAP